MPNAGIHETRSTICKSADAGSNRAQSSSVSPNTTREATSATWRTNPSREPSRFGMNRSSPAAASGSATMDERIGNVIRLFAPPLVTPHVITEHSDHADEDRGGVNAHRAGLPTAQDGAARPDESPGAVHGPVDEPRIHTLPQEAGRQALDRLDNHQVVCFVHVVLVQQQPVQWGRARGDGIGGAPAADEEVPGEADPDDRDDAG